ncbi:RNA polymerase sigma factor [Kurthia zopfii]|uniref:RNA polymerase sigma factor sigM n=1 Tax=Kurthia zopfii TaxID=1650 RepID=A0A2U3ACW0_9BACL|nr:RNA polymerase sigma factor [Kurthia zopfii]PWI22384.1 RNA polymerase sigma factor [Kurthia zopfii]TDR38486.1 RNA polymerase sigma-70 factor (ECF subfamily) [Kurthia zopfii]STX08576.1 RNA polymerase sigma factor sigM [Kurthia zopfii]VEI05215.1 RNA polymerase sigma factor sigM [Kurthia zopfii]GEK30451.1 RNA polymerase sigma factor [Kurthia zopfii]
MTIQLETVYEEYNRYIYHLCLKLTRNKAEAEDLMQEVWVKVVRYESYVAQVDHLKAWLTTICMNTFRDRYRKNVRRSKYMMNQPDTLDVPILDLVPNNELTTEELIEKEDVASLVQSKINELDGIYRNTLLYFYVNQYSLVEIAEIMKVSIGTVKSRLFRAKQRLKEMMLNDVTTASAILPA